MLQSRGHLVYCRGTHSSGRCLAPSPGVRGSQPCPGVLEEPHPGWVLRPLAPSHCAGLKRTHLRRGLSGEVPSQGGAATGEAARQATWAWAARKGKPRPRVGRGRGITGGGDSPAPPPPPIEENVEWEGAAPGSPQGWKRGSHGNAPRTGPDVTVGRAPRPPPSSRRAAPAPPTPGSPHWWPRRSLFRTHQ